MHSSRVIAVVSAAVLAGLVAAAVSLQLGSDASSAIDPAHLVVGHGPPSTATATITYSDNEQDSATATCAFDFTTGVADVTATASLTIATVSLEVRLGAGAIDLNVAQFESLVGAPWVSLQDPQERSRLDGLARFFRHPDLARLRREHGVTSVTRNGRTVTTLPPRLIHLPSTEGLPIILPREGLLAATLTTGRQGQVLSIDGHLVGQGETAEIDLQMTGYDVSVRVAAPSPGQVVPLTSRRARAVFGTNATSLPRYLRKLGSLRL